MALIENTKGRGDDIKKSGYYRLLGIEKLALLISKTQSATISSGNELESVLLKQLKLNQDMLKKCSIEKHNKDKRVFKKIKGGKDVNVDLVIYDNNFISIIEIKDGDTFDTKKIAGEKESLELVKKYLKKNNENVEYYFCSFNSKSRQEIIVGTKNLFNKENILTGEELCNLLGIDFNKIKQYRIKDRSKNIKYFKKVVREIFNL